MHSRFDTEARIAVAQATDIARELGHSQVGPDHLLLGLLANMRGSAYAALTDHGVRLDAVREIVVTQHTDDTDTDPTTNTATRTAESPTGSEEATGLEEDRAALRAIGIDLDRVREAVRENLGTELTDGWGARPERGRRGRGRGERGERDERDEDRRGHGPRGRHHHREGGERGERGRDRGRGRRGPRSRRLDGLTFSAGLRDVLREVRRATIRARHDDDVTVRETAHGMTGQRLLLALIASDDAVVGSALATATDLDGLRARLEAAVTSATAA